MDPYMAPYPYPQPYYYEQPFVKPEESNNFPPCLPPDNDIHDLLKDVLASDKQKEN